MNDHTELKKAAEVAEKGGHHIYTNPRDSNNWNLNEQFIKLASPAAVLALLAELEAAKVDQEIAQFARDTSVIPGLAEALDPFMEALNEETSQDPATNEDWYAIMSKLLAAAKESGLWPVKPELVLTEDAQADRDAFNENYGDGNCSCHNNAPCSSCTHPGNPTNQEEDSACWTVAP